MCIRDSRYSDGYSPHRPLGSSGWPIYPENSESRYPLWPVAGERKRYAAVSCLFLLTALYLAQAGFMYIHFTVCQDDQPIQMLPVFRIGGDAEAETQKLRFPLAPVSYTHLDVYKRQD